MSLLKNSLLLVLSMTLIPQSFANNSQQGNKNNRGVVVDVQTVQAETYQEELVALGTVYARNQIDLTSRVAGFINTINFSDGDKVAKGHSLIELDSRYESARLQEAKARLAENERRLSEIRALEAKKAISQSELQAQEAIVEESRASVIAAETTLSFYSLEAPFAGVLGLNSLSQGQYIQVGAPLVTLTDMESLYVDLNFPDKYLSQIKTGMSLQLSFEAWANQTFKAEITTMDPLINVESRNFRVRANLDNTEGNLRPGLLAQATLQLNPHSIISIPTSSVFYRGPQAFVYRLDNNKAAEQPIDTFQIVGEKTFVTSGLKVGDQIITAGVGKVSNGVVVTPSSPISNDKNQKASIGGMNPMMNREAPTK